MPPVRADLLALALVLLALALDAASPR